MRKRKVLAAAVSAVMAVGTFAGMPKEAFDIDFNFSVSAYDIIYECGDFGDNVTAALSYDGVLTISGTGNMQEYYYPSQNTFYESDEITSVIIQDGVTSIPKWGFAYCSSLESITISDSIKSIGDSAFVNCNNLRTYVYIPETVEMIGTFAFGYIFNTLSYAACDYYWYDKIDNFVIYGVSGSAAEEYAIDYGFTFIDVNKPVSVSSKTFSLSIGSSEIVTVDNYAGEVEWYSDNEDVATVNGGYVRAVSSGTANIYAIAGDEEFTIPVTVSDDLSVTDPAVTTVVTTTTSTSESSVSTTTTTEPSDIIPGDANGDGEVNVRDASTIARMLAEKRVGELPLSADFNGDGEVNVRDAAAIAKALAKGEI